MLKFQSQEERLDILKEPMDILKKGGERAKFGLFPAKTGPGKQNYVKICIHLLPYTISFPQVETQRWLTAFKTRSTQKT